MSFAFLIQFLTQILTFLVIVATFMSFFLSPYHPARQTIDRIVNPMLNPIRRIFPPMGGLDFSPMVLIILIQVLGQMLIILLPK